MAKSVLIMGHSYVRRLVEHLQRYRQHNLGLQPDQYFVQFAFRGGAHLDFLKAPDTLRTVRRIRPSLVLLEIGTNDLSLASTNPLILAAAVFQFARRLIDEFQVTRVVVCQIVHRFPGPRFTFPYAGFNEAVDAYNAELQRLAAGSAGSVVFWRHPRMQLQVQRFIVDGVHFNFAGMKKHLNSLKHAVVKFA